MSPTNYLLTFLPSSLTAFFTPWLILKTPTLYLALPVALQSLEI